MTQAKLEDVHKKKLKHLDQLIANQALSLDPPTLDPPTLSRDALWMAVGESKLDYCPILKKKKCAAGKSKKHSGFQVFEKTQ